MSNKEVIAACGGAVLGAVMTYAFSSLSNHSKEVKEVNTQRAINTTVGKFYDEIGAHISRAASAKADAVNLVSNTKEKLQLLLDDTYKKIELIDNRATEANKILENLETTVVRDAELIAEKRDALDKLTDGNFGAISTSEEIAKALTPVFKSNLEPLVSESLRFVRRENCRVFNTGSWLHVEANCPENSQVISGGCSFSDWVERGGSNMPTADNGWRCTAQSTEDHDVKLCAIATCLTKSSFDWNVIKDPK